MTEAPEEAADEVSEEAPAEPEQKKKGFFARLVAGISKTFNTNSLYLFCTMSNCRGIH